MLGINRCYVYTGYTKKAFPRRYKVWFLADSVLFRVQSRQVSLYFISSFSVCGRLEESYSVLNTVFNTMKTYGQRISFASGRVEMLQGDYFCIVLAYKIQLRNS